MSPVSEFNGLLKQWGIELKEAGQVDVAEVEAEMATEIFCSEWC